MNFKFHSGYIYTEICEMLKDLVGPLNSILVIFTLVSAKLVVGIVQL